MKLNKRNTFSVITVFSLFLFTCKTSPGRLNEIHNAEQSIKSTPDSFSAAFYNVENLFDLTTDGTEYNEYNPSLSNWNADILEKKLSNIAEVIAEINADITGLCEIESFKALKKLQKKLSNRGCPYNYAAYGDLPLKTNTCVALLSRFPIKNILCHEVRFDDGKASRSILEADVLTPCAVIKVFVNHWPSKSHPESTRIRAASVLENRLDKLPKETEYLLIGDFNSNYNECVTNSNNNDSSFHKTGINSYLKTIITQNQGRFRYVTDSDMLSNHDGLYDTWLDLPEEMRRSMVYNGYKQTPDHILLPSSLFDSSGISYIDNSFTPVTLSGKLLKGNTPFRWQLKQNGKMKIHTGQGFSDHLPVLARFQCNPFRKTDKPRKNGTPAVSNIDNRKPMEDIAHVSSLWTACNSSVSLSTSGVSEDRQLIHLQCDTLQSNKSIARKSKMSIDSTIGFKIRGSGKISFRFRTDDKKWIYFNAPDFKCLSIARYKEVRYNSWTDINCKLPHEYCNRQLEIEIRAGKEQPFSFDIEEL